MFVRLELLVPTELKRRSNHTSSISLQSIPPLPVDTTPSHEKVKNAFINQRFHKNGPCSPIHCKWNFYVCFFLFFIKLFFYFILFTWFYWDITQFWPVPLDPLGLLSTHTFSFQHLDFSDNLKSSRGLEVKKKKKMKKQRKQGGRGKVVKKC